MHIALRHVIEPGDVYFVCFPKWETGWEEHTTHPPDFWHETSVLACLEGEDFWGRPEVKRMDKIPLGSTALVVGEVGKGPEVEGVGQMYAKDGKSTADRFVLCLVTDITTDRSFLAVVGCTELWPEDPRVNLP